MLAENKYRKSQIVANPCERLTTGETQAPLRQVRCKQSSTPNAWPNNESQYGAQLERRQSCFGLSVQDRLWSEHQNPGSADTAPACLHRDTALEDCVQLFGDIRDRQRGA